MLREFTVAACVMLVACGAAWADASDPAPGDGELILSVGSTSAPATLGKFLFSAHGDALPPMLAIAYRAVGHSCSNVFGSGGGVSWAPGLVGARDPDFEGHASGIVTIDHLKPGQYEICSIGITKGVKHAGPAKDVSIPFTINAGASTYIGSFTSVEVWGSGIFGINMPLWAYVVVSDEHERDIAIAQKREPQLMPQTISVMDVSTLNEPFLQPKELQ